MRILAIVLAFLAAAGLTMLAMGVFDPSPAEPTPPTPPRTGPEDGGTGTVGPLEVREPSEQPEPEIAVVEQPLRILFVGGLRQSFAVWLTQQWVGAQNVAYRAAYQDAEASPATEQSPGEKPLSLPPTQADLEGVDVVVLHGVDPGKLGSPFLEALARRVRERTTGLLVVPTLLGAVVHNPAQASAVGSTLGMVLAALGGAGGRAR